MADIIRKNPGASLSSRTWDPFEVMRELVGWDPFKELGRGVGGIERSFTPAFELKETKDSFVLKADLPGVKEEDLDVSVTGNRLTVSGKREAEKTDEGESFYTYERSYGSFMRSFTIPEGCDLEHIDADLKNGELKIVLPKRAEVQPKKISLKGLKEKVAQKAKA